ncbi:MAG: prepilin-type N-terminal cleavage/methylation domain-containing protein [Deltaproteobacteria bacterium]|nr:prepilin-type N-terminal cleavage/methylation domain-containing protein [Deltaproteobacteria bacterium]
MRRRASGFSLIELMIVVAIIAVLAAIAIPRYTTFVLRARQAEGYTMMTVAKNAQFTHFATFDCFAAVSRAPAVGVPGPVPRAWDSAVSGVNEVCPGWPGPPTAKTFEDLSVRPSTTMVYFEYSCTATYQVGAGTSEFACCAEGDLDGDANRFEMIYGTDEDGDGATLATCSSGTVSNFPLDAVRVSVAVF